MAVLDGCHVIAADLMKKRQKDFFGLEKFVENCLHQIVSMNVCLKMLKVGYSYRENILVTFQLNSKKYIL
jgi:hypothetical protein